jgi:hypothetical protein
VPGYLDFAVHPGIYYRLPALSQAPFAVCALGACPAIASAWLWRRGVTVGLALVVTAAAALACGQAHLLGDPVSDVRLIGSPLVLAALASWPLVAGLFPVAFFATLGVALLWLAVDARPAIAFGMYFEVIYVLRSFAMASRLSDAPTVAQGLIIALLAAALAGVALRVRRSAET